MNKFSEVELYPMGGGLGTVGMLITQFTNVFKYRLLKYTSILIAKWMVVVD